MKYSIGTKITTGFVVAFMALMIISVVSFRNITGLNSDARLVTHTLEVLERLEGFFSGLMEAQGSARGYCLAPSVSAETIFNNAALDINVQVQLLRTLTRDNLVQQERLGKLEPITAARLAALRKLMEVSSSNAADKAAQITTMVQGGRLQTEAIRQLVSEIEKEERGLLEKRRKQAEDTAQFTLATISYGTLLAFLAVGGIGLVIIRSITSPLQALREGAAKIGGGDYAHRVGVSSKDEVGELASGFNLMAEQVQQRQNSLADQDWVKTSLSQFSALFQGQRDPTIVCQTILDELASLLDARHSVFYVPDNASEKTSFKLCASYACENPRSRLGPGEGLVGQCFLEGKRILMQKVPDSYVQICSGLGGAQPASIVVQPALFEGRVKAVLELASLQPFTQIQLAFLGQLAESIGLVLNTIEAGMRTEELLRQAQALSDTLQTKTERLLESEQQLQQQQEELNQSNEELEQTNEELRQTTEEIEEKADLLADQKRETDRINQAVEQARSELEKKAQQLALTSKYKSEFLANMSHELRTPLNSLLILSKMLEENPESNLSPKQVRYAKTIHSSGNDLLELINDILDLSKIESGTVEIESDELRFADLAQFVEDTFRHVAEDKKLGFQIRVDPQLPKSINTDIRRLQQVLKNILSNAFKFTEKGSVELKINSVTSGWDPQCETLNEIGEAVAIAATDTGIGIPVEKQQIIFEAFQQAEAGTTRKYGGTGLGLSISREIARLLGGSLCVESLSGQGSTFTLYLPTTVSPERLNRQLHRRHEGVAPKPIPALIQMHEDIPFDWAGEIGTDGLADDRANLHPGDLVILIIEDDRNFASVLVEFARAKAFKAVVARTASQGILLASHLRPAAITLDIRLPDNDGWMVLDWLKHDSRTRHIPVHIVTVDEGRERGLKLGAVSFLQKPVTREALEDALSQTVDFINRPVKKLLVIEDVLVQRQNIVDLIGNGDVATTAVGTAAEALAALGRDHFDCVVLDLGLPDMGGAQLIAEIQKRYGHRAPPIIVYTSKELTRAEETELRKVSESIIIKDVRSPERLLDETALFLHRVQSKLPEPKQRIIEQIQKSDSVLSNRKVLVVDDDVRNIFAITSALESHKMQVLYAENGQAGIDTLQEHPDIEVVLMDVMMPEMDGFEAIRRIREMEQFKKLPIISVTAKAMKGDREKCLEAGASDYITKPVNMDQLRSLLRVWLYK